MEGVLLQVSSEIFFLLLCKMHTDGAEFTVCFVLLCNHQELEGLQGGRVLNLSLV